MIGPVALALALAAPPERWFAPDKLKHFFMAAFTQSVGYSALQAARVRHDRALLAASVGTAAVSIGKELHDRRTSGVFSARDLVWDAAGAGVATLLIDRARRRGPPDPVSAQAATHVVRTPRWPGGTLRPSGLRAPPGSLLTPPGLALYSPEGVTPDRHRALFSSSLPDRLGTPSDPHRMTDQAGNNDKERRKNAALRALIDELLFCVRDANQHVDMWTPEERARAEQELSTIMARVRGAAMEKTTN